MNFTPVTGHQLEKYDAETIALYSKRVSDVRLTEALLAMTRETDRNKLPVVANPVTQWQQDRQSYMSTIGLKTGALLIFSMFAMTQFSKAYFPFGVVLRNSIP